MDVAGWKQGNEGRVIWEAALAPKSHPTQLAPITNDSPLLSAHSLLLSAQPISQLLFLFPHFGPFFIYRALFILWLRQNLPRLFPLIPRLLSFIRHHLRQINPIFPIEFVEDHEQLSAAYLVSLLIQASAQLAIVYTLHCTGRPSPYIGRRTSITHDGHQRDPSRRYVLLTPSTSNST